jgi:hypothetical protein
MVLNMCTAATKQTMVSWRCLILGRMDHRWWVIILVHILEESWFLRSLLDTNKETPSDSKVVELESHHAYA